VAREVMPFTILVGFIALGWSFEWFDALFAPRVTLDAATTVSLSRAVNAPFFLGSFLVSCLWLRMLRRPHPWTLDRSSGVRRTIASLWWTAAAIAFVAAIAPMWLRSCSVRMFHWWIDGISLEIAMLPLLPFAAGWAALRFLPPPAFTAARRDMRWLRRAAWVTVIACVVSGSMWVSSLIGWRMVVGTGAAVSPMLQFIFHASLIAATIMIPLGLLSLWISLLRIVMRARGFTPGSNLIVATLGGTGVLLLVSAVAIHDTASERVLTARGSMEPSTSDLIEALRLLARHPSTQPQLTILLLATGIALLWVVAALAPAFVTRYTARETATTPPLTAASPSPSERPPAPPRPPRIDRR